MPDAPPASILGLLRGLELGPLAQDAGNRLAVEGMRLKSGANGVLEIGLGRVEAASLRLAAGPVAIEIGSLALQQVLAQVRMDEARPRLSSLEAASAELSGVKVRGPLRVQEPRSDFAWSLAPLAAADGTVRAEIVDAHLVFDADVTVPIRQGQVDFGDATVEHVGPDSRMGVSRLGIYVDAPNGRSYLCQFSSAPLAGVEFERRGALLGPWVTDRGKLRLQEFAEAVLRQGRGTPGSGLTDQSRLLFDRTAVSGEVQLGDGRFAAPGVRADLVGRAENRNLVRVHSEAVGRGLTAQVPALSVQDAVLQALGAQLRCRQVTGALSLQVLVEGGQLRFALELPKTTIAGLRVDTAAAASGDR